MKSFFTILFISISLCAFPDIVLHESPLSLPYDKPDIVFNFENYILIVNPLKLPLRNLRFLSNACGYDIREITPPITSFFKVKSLINAFIDSNGMPTYILLIGDETIVPAYKNYLNPYTNAEFVTDCEYGNINNEYINTIPVSRIPINSQSQIDNYLDGCLKYLKSDNYDINYMGHFYDTNLDSIEDYLYIYTINEIYSKLISLVSSGFLITSDSELIKYFFDGSLIPSYLTPPEINYSFDINDLNNAYENAALTVFWGHSNRISTVSPSFSLYDLMNFNAQESGVFIFLSCLVGDFGNYNKCLAESLLCCNNGISAIIASSSETFYNYNRFMMLILFDYFDNSIFFKHTEFDNCEAGYMLNSLKHYLLSSIGINDYSLSQIRSYNLLGLPFISVFKNGSAPSICISDSINLQDPVLSILSSDTCFLTLFTHKGIYDTLTCFAENIYIQLDNIEFSDTLFVSIFKNGILFIDTCYISIGNIQLSLFSINDSIGDFDFLAEEQETLFIKFLYESDIPICTLNFASNELFLFDTSMVISTNCNECSVKVFIQDTLNIATLNISSNNLNYNYSFPVYRRKLFADSFITRESGIIYKDSLYTITAYFHTGNHAFDNTVCIFKSNSTIEFEIDTQMLPLCTSVTNVFNTAHFKDDSGYFYIKMQTRFYTDSFLFTYRTSPNKTIFIYDPRHKYSNSDFNNFLRDSLKLNVLIDSVLNSETIYPYYMIMTGDYSDNKVMDEILAEQILNFADLGSTVYLEGTDCLCYDKAGKLLWDLFGIKNGDDGYNIYKSDFVYLPNLKTFSLINKNLNFVDVYDTDTPYIIDEDNYLSSFGGTHFCQSIPLYTMNTVDDNYLYYIYSLILCDFNASISIDNVNLNDSMHFRIYNAGQDPILFGIDYLPFFIDSIKFAGRIILPDSFIKIQCYLKEPILTSVNDDLIISYGFNQSKTTNVTYSPFSGIRNAQVTVKKNIIIICTDADRLIIPKQFADKIKIKKTETGFVLSGDSLSLIDKKTILLIKDNKIINKIKIDIPFKKQNLIYNILGQQLNKASTKGVFFNNGEKIVKIR